MSSPDPNAPPPDPNAAPPRLPHHTDAYLAETKGPTILATCITLCVVSTMFVAARLFTRQKLMGKLLSDDYIVGASILFQWACVAIAIMAVNNGNGRHFDTLSLNDMQGAIFWTILGFPFGVVAFGLPKLAVVSLLTRLLNPDKWHKIFLWIMALLCFGSLLGCIVILFAQCSPAKSQWDFSITEKTCIDKWVLVDYAIFAGGFSAFTDLYLAVYPAVVLWSLQMRLRKKLALCVALGIGSIATVVAIYKCTRLPSLASPDFSYDTADLVIWTIVEASTIIIACCIPILQPLVDLIFGRRALNGSSGYKNYGKDSSSNPQYRSDIEMHKGPSNGRSGNQSHASTKRTLVSILDRTEVDSQESILGDREENRTRKESGDHAGDGRQQQNRTYSHSTATAGRMNMDTQAPSQIVRTDVVTITYDSDRPADGPHNNRTSWVKM